MAVYGYPEEQEEFLARVKSIFPRHEVYQYVECPGGAKEGPTKGSPWIEFYLIPHKRAWKFSTEFVSLKQLRQLARLFGTEDIEASALDLSDPADMTDHRPYLVAHGVTFRKFKR